MGVWLIAGLLSIGACGGLAWLFLRQDQAPVQLLVLVTNPPPGQTRAAGSHELVSAKIVGRQPITRAELWVDGKLQASDSSPAAEGRPTFYGNFDLSVPLGAHLLFVRGVDAAGTIGQSLPVSILGIPKPAKVFYSVPVGPGATWADLAHTYSTDQLTLAALNPSLAGQNLAAGTRVVVPAIAGSAAAPASAAPPATSPGSAPITVPAGPPLQSIDLTNLIFERLIPLALPHLPAAPTGLQGEMDNCNIKLTWKDNADNETRYDVWEAGDSAPRVIASLKPGRGGPVWAELTAPEAGDLRLWVEAVNSIGGQPSNIISLTVEAKCAPLPTKLQIEALEITASGGHDRNYCYVSLQGAPEIRIPEQHQRFLGSGKGALQTADLKKKYVVPVPSNGLVDISGECWGWAGKNLDKLGSFSHQFASDTWNGQPQVLAGGEFKISVVFTKQGDSGSVVLYDKPEDPKIPIPYDIRESGYNGYGTIDPKLRSIRWKWSANGDPKIKVTSFEIYLNGVLVGQRSVAPLEQLNPPLDWKQDVTLPYECWYEEMPTWQVAALTADAESPKGLASQDNAQIEADHCKAYALVDFYSVYVPCSGKYMHGYFYLTVNGETRQFWGSSGADGGYFAWIDCGENKFYDLIDDSVKKNYGGEPQFFLVPIDLNANPNGYMDVVGVVRTDGDDLFGQFRKRYQTPVYGSSVSGFDKCSHGNFTQYADDMGNSNTRFTIDITTYPNSCNSVPPSQYPTVGGP